MIAYPLLLLAVLLLVTTVDAANNSSWEGNLPITYYEEDTTNCSGENYWGKGYASSLKSLNNGDLCEKMIIHPIHIIQSGYKHVYVNQRLLYQVVYINMQLIVQMKLVQIAQNHPLHQYTFLGHTLTYMISV